MQHYIWRHVDVSSNFFVVRNNSVTRGHRYRLMLEHCDNNSQKQFLSRRIAKVWNGLPTAAVDFTNLVSIFQSQPAEH